MIPALDASGNLPVGRHQASLAEIWAAFVDGAPNQGRRQLIFRALEVYVDLVWALLPGSTLWVDGGFMTHKTDEPHDVDIVIVAHPRLIGTVKPEATVPLLTMHGVTMQEPYDNLGLLKLQPMGDLVDGFLVWADDSNKLNYWHNLWSTVNPKTGSGRKGYLEIVTP